MMGRDFTARRLMAPIALVLGIAASLACGANGPAAEETEEEAAQPVETATAVPPADTPVPSAGDTWTRPVDGMVMVYIPAGEFEMGSEEGDPDEQPVHRVRLDAFWIDRTEATVAQFRDFVHATGHETTAEQQGWGWAWLETSVDWQKTEGADWQHPQGPGSQTEDDHPVVQVSWRDAVAYCEWAGARLPSEAEWEYAARGPEGRVYPWGDLVDRQRLNYCDARCPTLWPDMEADDGYATTAPVGSFPAGASWCGAHGLGGNVGEHVADWYDGDYYSRSPTENPTGPATGRLRVSRGGSWGSPPDGARGANRGAGPPEDADDADGFRCAMHAE